MIRSFKFKGIVIPILFFSLFTGYSFAQNKTLIDDFETASNLKIVEAEQVEVKITNVEGIDKNCLRLDYNFKAGSGYGGIQKKFPVQLPENYEFSFYLKADSPDNTLEFKLLDEEGTSVWWFNNRNYSFPKEWTKYTIKQRQISKAWGPSPLLKPKKIDKIEIFVTSINGGKGTLYIDKFCLEQKPPVSAAFEVPLVKTSSSLSDKYMAEMILDGNTATEWRSRENPSFEEMIIDLKSSREFGGIVILQDSLNYALQYDISISDDSINWRKVYSVKNGKWGKSFIDIRESDAQFIKLNFIKCSGQYYAIKEIEIKPISFTENKNVFFEAIAKEKPKGFYPKYFNPEQSNFTVIGVNKDVKEALINEEGMIESDKQSFSVEPFIYLDNEFINWNCVKTAQKLEKDYLPIPFVTWDADKTMLEIKAFADGEAGNSFLNISYTVINTSSKNQNGSFYLAVRPFQVNPPAQFLNTTGGTAKIDTINYFNEKIFVNSNKVIIPLQKPAGFGASEFDRGDITDFISKDILPTETNVTDHYSAASGALKYSFDLQPGEKKSFYFLIPFHNTEVITGKLLKGITPEKFFARRLNGNIKFWEEKLDFAKFDLPKSANKLINTLRTSLAYILINRDNNGFQPGSRSYERSWIRDGAMTSSSLLKMGITKEVKEYIDWYSEFQYPNGKIPCVVDTRGPDPVPENDSHGEYLFLLNQYFQFTKDTAYLKSKFDNVKKTVEYMEFLINQRKTKQYVESDSLKLFYGLLPESISHEGYSEKPMHSYWDDFWGLKGLKDAVEIASVLNEKEYLKNFAKLMGSFKTDFYSSMMNSIEKHKIDYIPGCAELGDFDATSTAIGLLPCNEKKNMPEPYLKNTFMRYYDFFKKRRDDKNYDWVNYTPYELRTVGAFNYLDLPNISHEMLDYFFKDQLPNNWNHWAEVVWRDKKAAKFIGDMPHTWVASDFVNSVRSFFVYEDEINHSLVLGSGLYKEWIDAPGGMKVSNLNTYYGTIDYSVNKNGSGYVFNISGKIKKPKGNIVIKNFNAGKLPKEVFVNGKSVKEFTANSIIIYEFPAKVEIKY